MTKITKSGFTIIEVVLVLAIAALVFLMAFVAFPALQRSQRDTQRRQDMRNVMAEFINYRTNNGGSWPFSHAEIVNFKSDSSSITDSGCSTNAACLFVRDYMNSKGTTSNTFKDPDDTEYSVAIYGESSKKPTSFSGIDKHTIVIKQGARCKDVAPYWEDEKSLDGRTQKGDHLNDFVIIYKLENSDYFCLESK